MYVGGGGILRSPQRALHFVLKCPLPIEVWQAIMCCLLICLLDHPNTPYGRIQSSHFPAIRPPTVQPAVGPAAMPTSPGVIPFTAPPPYPGNLPSQLSPYYTSSGLPPPLANYYPTTTFTPPHVSMPGIEDMEHLEHYLNQQ